MIPGNNCLKRSTPEQQGVSSKSILDFLNRIESITNGTKDEFHSFIIIKNDCIIAEGYSSPHEPSRFHRIYSTAKGIVAVAILFAMQEGIVSLDEKIVDIFENFLPENVDDNMREVTVYHLLTMNSGHAEDTCMQMFASDNWIKTFLSIPPRYKPGTHFTYNNGIPHILAAIIKKKTGLDINDYLKPRFLDILDIQMHCVDNPYGEYEPSNVCISQKSLAKIGYFFLKKGVWNGRRLLSEELCEEFGAFHVPASSPEGSADHPERYGWQVWSNPYGDGYTFRGGRDNHIVIMPSENMVFTCMACNQSGYKYAGSYNAPKFSVLDIFFETIYSSMYKQPVATDPYAAESLKNYIENWNMAPKGNDNSPLANVISGKTYVFGENAPGCESVRIDFSNEHKTAVITSVYDNTEHKTVCGFNGAWVQNKDYLILAPNYSHGNITHSEPLDNMLSGSWKNDSNLVIKGRSYSRIESDIFSFIFSDDKLYLHVSTAVLAKPGFSPGEMTGQFDLLGRAK